MEGSLWDLDSESVDDVLLLSEVHWTFLRGLSLSGLGDVQEAGLEDSMEGLAWARSWEKVLARARCQRSEVTENRRRDQQGRKKGGSGEVQGSKINRPLSGAGNARLLAPCCQLPVSGTPEVSCAPASFVAAAGAQSDMNCR